MPDADNEPVIGTPLRVADVNYILEEIGRRRLVFRNEPLDNTIMTVLMNIGDKWTMVKCVNGEWGGRKMDIPQGPGLPKCPNGHVLMQGLERVRLGWVEGEVL